MRRSSDVGSIAWSGCFCGCCEGLSLVDVKAVGLHRISPDQYIQALAKPIDQNSLWCTVFQYANRHYLLIRNCCEAIDEDYIYLEKYEIDDHYCDVQLKRLIFYEEIADNCIVTDSH